MNIVKVVMAHPAREKSAVANASALNASIVWDEGRGVWDTARRAWQSTLDGDYGLVVQDDAILSKNLSHLLPTLVRPDNIVSLYYGTSRPNHQTTRQIAARAKKEGSSWIAGPGPWWAVALLAPTHQVEQFLPYGDTKAGGDDARIWWWYQTRKIWCYYTWPSLVDHDDQPSLVYKKDPIRREAHLFLNDANQWTPGNVTLMYPRATLPRPERTRTPMMVRIRDPRTNRVRRVREADVRRYPDWEVLDGHERPGGPTPEPEPIEGEEPAVEIGLDTEPEERVDVNQSVPKVLEAVGSNKHLAQQALEDEMAREKPRVTLVVALEGLLDA